MNLFQFIKNFRIRYKFLFVYSFTFVVIIGISGLIVYSIVKQTVKTNIESELQNSTSAILNTVKTAVSVSIKNHLRAAAERNHEIIQHLYNLQARGDISLEEAKERAADIILNQKIGTNGYVCLLDGNGKVLKHPEKSLEGLDISDHKFVREMIAKKNGYIEYSWKNPGDAVPRPKALYLNYFEPWDWMITVSSYRKEFARLVDINDFKENILGLKFGKTGYSYVMDTRGNVIIHPELSGINIFDTHDFSTQVFKQMLEKKIGKLVYSWKSPADGQVRKKMVIFNHIPEYEWIVASSSYLDEVFSFLNTIKIFIILVGLASLILFVPITFVISSTITKPLQELRDRFNQEIMGGFSNRQVKMKSRDEVGQLSSYYNSFMDKLDTYSRDLEAEIADRRQAQEALQESEEKYRSVMEATPDPIVVYDMQGAVTYMNPAFTRVFGYTLTDSLGEKMGNFFPKAQWKKAMAGIETLLAGQVLPRTETQRTSRDGRLIDVTLRGSVYRDKDGHPKGLVITYRDVSEVKRLEKAIMETGEKERQKIGNDLHDDLCPHLIGIEGLSRVLKGKLQGHPEEAAALSDNITDLIRDAISKTRRLARGLCPVYFNHGLESSLQELAASTKILHGIECRLDCRGDIPARDGMVTTHLYHIVQEAVQNAVRHGRADSIEIRMEKEAAHLILRVTDNGTGMDTSKASAGMGLRIMDYRAGLVNASLGIRSNTGGTRVSIRLPLTALA